MSLTYNYFMFWFTKFNIFYPIYFIKTSQSFTINESVKSILRTTFIRYIKSINTDLNI